MSTENNALAAMLAQYETNNKPTYEKKSEKVYDLKNYFNTFIKEGVKSATKQIRILSVESGSPFVEFSGHKIKVDGEFKTFACLKEEKGQPCPFCEAREALLATGKETDKVLAKDYKAKKMYIVKLIDRENEADGVKFWRFNHDWRKEGIYDKIIGVLNAIKKDITDPKIGRDLLLTINRNQNNIPVVSAVASLDPSPLSEDEATATAWLSDTRTWEDVYSVKSYEYLAIIVTGGSPVWDKEAKCYVDKNAATSEDAKLDAELTLGVENVKSGIVPATETSPEVDVDGGDAESETDDLPF